jgi:uncharacterized protein YkwD
LKNSEQSVIINGVKTLSMEEFILNNLTALILALTCGICGLPMSDSHSDAACEQPAVTQSIVCEQPASTQIDAANNASFDMNSLLGLLGQNGSGSGNNASFDVNSLLGLLGQNGSDSGNNASFDMNSLLGLLGQNGINFNDLGDGSQNTPTDNIPANNTPADNIPANNTPTDNSDNTGINAYVNEVIVRTNEARAEAGLSPLKAAPILNEMAKIRAEETVQLFDHTRPDGRSCFTVFDDYGVKYRAVAENIACGQRSPEEVVTAWLNSSGHRANIMNSAYDYIGVGLVYDENSAYGFYWSQFFYTPISGNLDGEYYAEDVANPADVVITEPITDPTTEPVTDPTTDPTTEPTTDPTTDPTTEPVTDPTTEPTTEPTTDPTTEPTTKPTTDPTTEPTTEPVTPSKKYHSSDLEIEKLYLHAITSDVAYDIDEDGKISGIDLALMKFILLK